VLIINIYPQGWNTGFSQLLVAREKVSCYSIYSYVFHHYVWAGIAGEGLATKTNRKWLMLLENDLPRFQIYSETSIHRFRQGSEKETMDPGKQ
jgi:hypothetical protein